VKTFLIATNALIASARKLSSSAARACNSTKVAEGHHAEGGHLMRSASLAQPLPEASIVSRMSCRPVTLASQISQNIKGSNGHELQ